MESCNSLAVKRLGLLGLFTPGLMLLSYGLDEFFVVPRFVTAARVTHTSHEPGEHVAFLPTSQQLTVIISIRLLDIKVVPMAK